MVRYPQNMVELRWVKIRHSDPIDGNMPTLQYRVKNISMVDYSETWTEWEDVPIEYIDE